MTDHTDAHMVRSTRTKSGATRKRPGLWHLASYGPTTLCGEPLDLATVHRLDLTRPRLIGPDVCIECVGVFDPTAVADAQRAADAGINDKLGSLSESTASDPSQGAS